jgi:hypothetical protein
MGIKPKAPDDSKLEPERRREIGRIQEEVEALERIGADEHAERIGQLRRRQLELFLLLMGIRPSRPPADQDADIAVIAGTLKFVADGDRQTRQAAYDDQIEEIIQSLQKSRPGDVAREAAELQKRFADHGPESDERTRDVPPTHPKEAETATESGRGRTKLKP